MNREKIEVFAETLHPLESPDYIDPDGCVNDNNSNQQFILSLDEYFNYDEYSVLDLGCAGGQFIVDLYKRGNIAVGLEGGNEEAMLTRAKGKHNWNNFKGVCLFHADVSQPYVIKVDGEPFKFDLVTGWDFFEHPDCSEIPGVIENIKKHLKPNGIVLGTINPSPGWKHRCANDSSWWDDMFVSHGFSVEKYPLNCTTRSVGMGTGGYIACFRLAEKND